MREAIVNFVFIAEAINKKDGRDIFDTFMTKNGLCNHDGLGLLVRSDK